jgi:hypothetical protein
LDVRQVGLELRRPKQTSERALNRAAFVERKGEAVNGLREIRIEGHCLEKRVNGSRPTTAPPLSLTEVGVTSGIARRQSSGASKDSDRILELAGLEGQDTEMKGRLRMIRIGRKHLTIEPLGLCKPAHAVVQNRGLENARVAHERKRIPQVDADPGRQ